MKYTEWSRTAEEWLMLTTPVALLMYYILSKLSRKIFQLQREQIVFSLVATIVIAPALTVGLFFAALGLTFYEPQKEFDQKAWSKDALHRFRMADDLVEKKTIEGVDTTQLKTIIGGKPITKTDTLWIYYIGTGGGVFLDHFLNIKIKGAKTGSVSHTAHEG
ncbi:hypothetical protein [Mucilaginibacter ginkgonis]|uniref:Uncharacterized protein n=1 Tax=Mucilaginibacter ginkgonis TaxID=2682091 RepID=A0A6I4INR9_9SPHI|nr:hypothetical protein [Mucilaginibacter ginkgonis]QQL48314.1 hypothetical protein GO620_008905 [Mucilaginibacter ginkgonis]